MPLWQSGFMDLGFSRRTNARAHAADPAFDYRMLLAKVSANQAISPTARAQAAIEIGEGDILSAHPEIAPFARSNGIGVGKHLCASFNPSVVNMMAAERKSL